MENPAVDVWVNITSQMQRNRKNSICSNFFFGAAVIFSVSMTYTFFSCISCYHIMKGRRCAREIALYLYKMRIMRIIIVKGGHDEI